MKAADWDARYAASELVWSAGPNRFVEEECGGLPPGRALDLGCGEGRNAVWLAGRGWRVTGADFSAVALAKGRARAEAAGVEVEWVEADVTAWDPPAGAFDLVAVVYVQLPPADRAALLGHAAAALAPGGTLLVIGHDLVNLTEGVGGPRNPEVLMTPEAVCAEIGGLEVVRAGRVTRQVDGAEAIDTLVRAVRP